MESSGGELRVDRRERHAMTPRVGFDLTPALRNPFIERKETAGETDSEVMVEPTLQRSPLWFVFGKKIDPLSDLSDRNDAEVQKLFRCVADPSGN